MDLKRRRRLPAFLVNVVVAYVHLIAGIGGTVLWAAAIEWLVHRIMGVVLALHVAVPIALVLACLTVSLPFGVVEADLQHDAEAERRREHGDAGSKEGGA
jgi:hypothetical protein